MIGASARAALTVVLGLCMAGGSARAAEGVVVRASVTPEEAWVGQRVRMHVEVLGADGWAKIVDMPALDLPGLYVLRTESQGVRLNETIGGTSYTGQRYELSVFCQRPGKVEIPALPLTVTVKQWGANATEVQHDVATPAVFLTCKVPPGAEGLHGLISTTRLTASQTWSSEPDTVALGDAITRTVTLSAVDVSSMAFPPMQHAELEGVGVYAGNPSVADETDRGSLRGRRVETVTYVCEQPGEVVLPGIVLPWWNIDAARLERIELPGLTLQVAGLIADAVADSIAIANAKSKVGPSRLVRGILVAVGIVLLSLGLGVHRAVGRAVQEWRRARRESEGAYFKRVTAALQTGESRAAYRAIMQWLDRLDTGTRPARLDVFLQRYGEEDARDAVASLARRLGSGDAAEAAVELHRLHRGLTEARARFLHARRSERRVSAVLPALNGGETPGEGG